MRNDRPGTRSPLLSVALLATLSVWTGCGSSASPPLVAADPSMCSSAFAPTLAVTNGSGLTIVSVNVFISSTTTLLFNGPAPIAPGETATVQSNAMVGQFVTIIATFSGGTFSTIAWPTQVLCQDHVFPIFL